MQGGVVRLQHVSLFLQNAHQPAARCSSPAGSRRREARLIPGFWRLSDVREATPGAGLGALRHAVDPLHARSAHGDGEVRRQGACRFWRLRDTIARAEQRRLLRRALSAALQELLATPLLFAAMSMLAAAFSLRLMRLGGLAAPRRRRAWRWASPLLLRPALRRAGRGRGHPAVRRRLDAAADRAARRLHPALLHRGRLRRRRERVGRVAAVQWGDARPMRGVRAGRIRNVRSLLLAAAAAGAFSPAPPRPRPSASCRCVARPAAPGLPLTSTRRAARQFRRRNDRRRPGQQAFYLEADKLVDDDRANRWTAHGQVEARYQGRTLRAKSVDLRHRTGVVTANGDVTMINADGTANSPSPGARRQDAAGVAMAFSARLPTERQARRQCRHRRSETVDELNQAIFTPCEICAANGAPIQPDLVDPGQQGHRGQEAAAHLLPQRGDPRSTACRSSTRRCCCTPTRTRRGSGLLMPGCRSYHERGLSYEQPILQVISPSEDLIVSPQINTKVNPFLNVDWRKRFYSGAIDVRGGYTYEQDFDSNGDKLGPTHLAQLHPGQGPVRHRRQLGLGLHRRARVRPADLRQLRGADPFIDRGLFGADDRRLISQLYSPARTATPTSRSPRSTCRACAPPTSTHLPAHRAPDRGPLGRRLSTSSAAGCG